jgi:hypothetical protein
MEARAPHDFEHDALVPGPGNAEHFSLAFTTWRKVKGGKGSDSSFTFLSDRPSKGYVKVKGSCHKVELSART